MCVTIYYLFNFWRGSINASETYLSFRFRCGWGSEAEPWSDRFRLSWTSAVSCVTCVCGLGCFFWSRLFCWFCRAWNCCLNVSFNPSSSSIICRSHRKRFVCFMEAGRSGTILRHQMFIRAIPFYLPSKKSLWIIVTWSLFRNTANQHRLKKWPPFGQPYWIQKLLYSVIITHPYNQRTTLIIIHSSH